MNNSAISGQPEQTCWRFYLTVYPFLDETIEEKMKTEALSRFSPIFSNKDDITAAVNNFCMAIRNHQNRLSQGINIDVSNSTTEVDRKVTSACAQIWLSYDPLVTTFRTIHELAKQMLPLSDCGMARSDNVGNINITLNTPYSKIPFDAFKETLQKRSLPCRWYLDKSPYNDNVLSIMLIYSPPQKE